MPQRKRSRALRVGAVIDNGLMHDEIEKARSVLQRAQRVVVLSGAGLSTESGIPDFRGPDGVWTKNPGAERLSSLQHYLRDPEIRKRAWKLRREHPAWTAAPNAGHRALVTLEQSNRLDTLITQNIDGLHLLAGTTPERCIEIHGTLRDVTCMSCGERGPMSAALSRVEAGEEDPRCLSCGGILKSATISFGQSLVREDLERAQRAARRCEVFLAAGTSLSVYPVAYLPSIALRAGAQLLIFNAQPTPYDDHASVLVRAPLGESLPSAIEPSRDE